MKTRAEIIVRFNGSSKYIKIPLRLNCSTKNSKGLKNAGKDILKRLNINWPNNYPTQTI